MGLTQSSLGTLASEVIFFFLFKNMEYHSKSHERTNVPGFI